MPDMFPDLFCPRCGGPLDLCYDGRFRCGTHSGPCEGAYTLADLDATPQYRQAFIDGDKGAEWVRQQATQDTTTD